MGIKKIVIPVPFQSSSSAIVNTMRIGYSDASTKPKREHSDFFFFAYQDLKANYANIKTLLQHLFMDTMLPLCCRPYSFCPSQQLWIWSEMALDMSFDMSSTYFPYYLFGGT